MTDLHLTRWPLGRLLAYARLRGPSRSFDAESPQLIGVVAQLLVLDDFYTISTHCIRHRTTRIKSVRKLYIKNNG